MHSRRKFAEAAFTMLELAVVGGAVAVIAILLLPAIQKVRETSNLAQCANQMKQMGLALQNYAMTYGTNFPYGNRVRNADWGSDASSPGYGPQDQSGWYVYILPFLGRDDYWNMIAPYLAPDDGVSTYASFGGNSGPPSYNLIKPIFSYPISGLPIYSIYDIPWDHNYVMGRALNLGYADGSQSNFWEFIQPPSIYTCPSAPDHSTIYDQRDMHPMICYSACMSTTAQNGGAQCGNYQAQATTWANLPGLPGAAATLSDQGWGGAPVTSATSIPGIFARGGYGTTAFANNFTCRVPTDVHDGISNTIALGETLPTQNTAWTEWRWLSSYMTPATTLTPINTYTQIFVMYNPCTPTWGGYTNDPPNQYCTGFPGSLVGGLCAPVPPLLQRNASYDYLYGGGFKSNHPGGANFCFADGSVHFISQNISMTTFQYLGCRNDGQAVQISQ